MKLSIGINKVGKKSTDLVDAYILNIFRRSCNIKTFMNKWVYYFVLLFTAQCFIGIQSSYSIAKQAIGEDFSLTQEDFGVLEMINMAGRFVGVIVVLISPIRRVKLTYIIFLIIQVLAYLMICGGHFLPHAVSAFLPISMFLIGSGAGIFMFPYLLLYKCFCEADIQEYGEQKDHKTAFNIWFGLVLLGHAPALLLGKWMIDDLELSWVISLFTFIMIYLFTGILTCIIVPESIITDDGSEDQTIGEKICSMFSILKSYLKRNISNIILVIQYCFIDNQPILIVYWVPFFFMQSGFGFLATWIALSFPVGVCLGSFTLTPLVGAFPKKAPILTSILLLLTALCFLSFWLVELKQENFGIFILLLGLACIFIITPYSRAGQTDVLERTTTPRQKYMAVNFMRMCTEILSCILMLTIGFIMEENLRNFLNVFTITPFIALALHIMRRFREKRENPYEVNKSEQSNKESEGKGNKENQLAANSQNRLKVDEMHSEQPPSIQLEAYVVDRMEIVVK